MKSNIQSRFSSIENSDVMDAMNMILNHHQYDFTNKKFGRRAIKSLVAHFKKPLDAAGFKRGAALVEWVPLKKHIEQYYRLWESPLKVWTNIVALDERKDAPSFFNMSILIQLILTIAFSSATVERGFSKARRYLYLVFILFLTKQDIPT